MGTWRPDAGQVAELGPLELRTATWGSGPADIVLLHDGLGSITQWRSVPERVAADAQCTVVAYERAGHGMSVPVPSAAWPADWLHREARVLQALSADLAVQRPVWVGHSDGGSTALIAACAPSAATRGVLALAPHSWVEDICFSAIEEMRTNSAAIVQGLARHHPHAHEVFEAWSGVWVSDAFRGWDIRPQLGAIEVPTLIAQGALDDYASEDHPRLTAEAIGSNASSTIVPDLGHIMHHDDPEAVAGLIVDFVSGVTPVR